MGILTGIESKNLTEKFIHIKNSKDIEKNVEKEVVDTIEKILSKTFKDHGKIETTYHYNTDGIIKFTKNTDLFNGALVDDPVKNFSVLIETKKDLDFSEGNRDKQLENRAIVISQVIYYYKRLFDNGEILPICSIIADNDEMFIVPSKIIKPYLLEDYNWNIAPSDAGTKNKELVKSLKENVNIAKIYVYHIKKGFNFNDIADRLISTVRNTKFEKIRVDSKSLAKSFEDFNRRVFNGSTVNTALQMSVFIQLLIGSENIYIHPNNKNVLVYSDGKDIKGNIKLKQLKTTKELPLNINSLQEFFEEYDKNSYTVEEQKKITEIADTLLDDFDRRFHGDFFTPKIWVDEAHKLIEKALNKTVKIDKVDEITKKSTLVNATVDWKEKYYVWDAACGTKNLTRDYKFKHLYSSTLHSEELVISENYNKENVAFQYDFLNDDIYIHSLTEKDSLFTNSDYVNQYENSLKIPKDLYNALKDNKPIVFFMNPPYGQATEQGGKTKDQVANNEIAKIMRKEKLGHAALELYTQFIKRVQMIAETFNYNNDFHFFFFNKGFITSPNFSNFTEELTTNFSFKDGFMLNAGEFNGTSSTWGIIFSHWSLKKAEDRTENNRQKEFPFIVKESFINKENNIEVRDIDKWIGKTSPEKTISDFIPKQKKKIYQKEYPTTANGFEKSKSKDITGRMFNNSIGYVHAGGSNIQFSDKYTGWYSLCFNSGHGYPVSPDNFVEVSVHFAIRKSILEQVKKNKQLWIRDKDVFPAPTQNLQNSEKWKKFVVDCVIYSLFANGSNQTSLRDYEFGEKDDGTPKKWNIINDFFWKDYETVKELSEERIDNVNTKNFNKNIQQDLLDFNGERFVYNWINSHNDDISENAQKVLDIVDDIFVESFQYRDKYTELYPKYQLNNWDAGWIQIYKMCFSQNSLEEAKENKKLQSLYKLFKEAFSILGDSIAKIYSEDTGF